MFGPNTVGSYQYDVWYSHRDEEFQNLFVTLQGLFQDVFNLRDYDILFIPGSGTLGIETVISSLKNSVSVIGPKGKFKNRWHAMSEHYRGDKSPGNELFCQLETSVSEIFSKEGCVVDAISSFPYYPLPANTKVFITSCNKQLGAFPGVSIVGVRQDCWDEFEIGGPFSCLNLSLYKKYSNIHQTPTTPPTALLEHLLAELSVINVRVLRKQINHVSDMITSAIGKENFVGETRCPVLTFKKSALSDRMANRWSLYGHGNEETSNYQIFTYSHPIEDYYDFVGELKNEGD